MLTPVMATLGLGKLVIDRDRQCVFVGNQATELTSIEVGLLWQMARHPEKVMTREQLWRAVWGKEVKGPTRTLDTHIARLRRKIEGNGPWMIRAVPRRGYVLTSKTRASPTKHPSRRQTFHSGTAGHALRGGFNAWHQV